MTSILVTIGLLAALCFAGVGLLALAFNLKTVFLFVLNKVMLFVYHNLRRGFKVTEQ